MVTYGSTMSKELGGRYNHLHAEATWALMNIDLFEAAGTIITLPSNFDGFDYLGGGCRKMKQIDTSLPNPDNLMDTGGLTPMELTTTNNPWGSF